MDYLYFSVYAYVTFVVILGSFRFDCLRKFKTKTDYNVFFIAYSEDVLLFIQNFFLKRYYDLNLFIYYVFVEKLELQLFLCFTYNSIIFGLYS